MEVKRQKLSYALVAFLIDHLSNYVKNSSQLIFVIKFIYYE